MKDEQNASPEAMIWFLFREGLPKSGALVALRHARVMPLEDTKEAVHFHKAYSYRRESDENFREAALEALLEAGKAERRSVAA